jgi:hypothetical protein
MPRIPAVLLLVVLFPLCVTIGRADPPVLPQPASCDLAADAAERNHHLPAGILAAIGRVESGRADGAGHVAPWPWTIDAAGTGAFMPSAPAAIAAVTALRRQGLRNIDVGCFQVNLQQHPDAFPSLDAAFDPWANAEYAAGFLESLRQRTGSWTGAVAAYHSSVPELGIPYREQVLLQWQDIMPWFGGGVPAGVLGPDRRRGGSVVIAGVRIWVPGAPGTGPTAIRVNGPGQDGSPTESHMMVDYLKSDDGVSFCLPWHPTLPAGADRGSQHANGMSSATKGINNVRRDQDPAGFAARGQAWRDRGGICGDRGRPGGGVGPQLRGIQWLALERAQHDRLLARNRSRRDVVDGPGPVSPEQTMPVVLNAPATATVVAAAAVSPAARWPQPWREAAAAARPAAQPSQAATVSPKNVASSTSSSQMSKIILAGAGRCSRCVRAKYLGSKGTSHVGYHQDRPGRAQGRQAWRHCGGVRGDRRRSGGGAGGKLRGFYREAVDRPEHHRLLKTAQAKRGVTGAALGRLPADLKARMTSVQRRLLSRGRSA